MSDKKVNIRTLNYSSLILMLVLTLGFLVFSNINYSKSGNNKKSDTTEISLNQSSATLCSGLQLNIIQKILVSDNENFTPLSYSQIQLVENKKVNQKISLLLNIQNEIKKNPPFIFTYYLFPAEKDELPHLS